MASFIIAYQKTGNAEGGYTNNPKDRGGETWCGISRKMWPTWLGWVRIDELRSVKGFPTILASDSLLNVQKMAFYRSNYWNVMTLDQANDQRIANELYDTAVNAGVVTAGMFLQRVLNVANDNGKYYPDIKVDGNVGPVTIAALNKHPKPLNILKALNCLQGAKYISICEANPSQEDFFNGWMTRVMEYYCDAA